MEGSYLEEDWNGVRVALIEYPKKLSDNLFKIRVLTLKMFIMQLTSRLCHEQGLIIIIEYRKESSKYISNGLRFRNALCRRLHPKVRQARLHL